MGIWDNMINMMMDRKLSSMTREEKKKMMEKMMPKRIKGMAPEDMMDMMQQSMMPKMMEYGSPNKLNELFNPPARKKYNNINAGA